jgi:hypothetical protein
VNDTGGEAGLEDTALNWPFPPSRIKDLLTD